MNSSSKWLIAAAFCVGLLGLMFAALFRPWLLSNVKYLQALLLLELIAAALTHYRRVYFPLLILIFLWAGVHFPLQGAAGFARWLVLGIGAWAGLILWLKDHRERPFGPFHLLALGCVSVAFVSTLVSQAPALSLLKAGSLFLLFLYAATGARIAIEGREAGFVRVLLLSCEVLTVFTAAAHLVHFDFFGNPNAVGAVMGVVVIPALFCDLAKQIATDKTILYRRVAILMTAALLLYQSRARASILAAAVSVTLLCIVFRRKIFLLRSAMAVILFLTAVGVVDPPQFDDFVTSVTSEVIYKGKPAEFGMMRSREGPWQATAESLRQHPWFGSGFGTSDISRDQSDSSQIYTISNREHGNSYLAIAEYMGWVGLVPFGGLIAFLLQKAWRMFSWMRTAGDPANPVVPIVMIVTAALIHAFFEDWLFAVGSYLCVFFWSLAFVLMDFVVPAATTVRGVVFPPWHSPVNVGQSREMPWARTSGVSISPPK